MLEYRYIERAGLSGLCRNVFLTSRIAHLINYIYVGDELSLQSWVFDLCFVLKLMEKFRAQGYPAKFVISLVKL